MPVDTSIPLSGQQINPMQSLASVVQTAGGIQAFKNAQAQGQAFQQQAEQGAQDLRERQHAVGVLKNIKSYQDSEGNIDYSRLVPDIMTGAPTTGAQYIQGIAQTQQSAASARKAVNDADAEQNQIVGNLLYSLKGKPPMMVHDVLTGVKEKYPNLLPAVEFAGKYLIAPTVQGSNSPSPQLDAALDQAGRMFQGSPTQQNMRTGQVSAIPTANGTQLTQLSEGAAQPQGAAIGEPIIPPNHVATDTSGGTQLVNDVTGQSKPITPANGAPSMTRPSGESGNTQAAAESIRANANQAARSIPDQQFNANQIIKLADETNTGKGAHIIAGLKGQFAGIPWTNDAASNYNRLGHFLSLQTSQLAQASGLGGTDAAHGIAADQAGRTDWTADAIKSTSRVNRALSTGAGLFNQGVENAVKNSGGNIYAARDFQNKWSGVADVNAMRLYDAIKNKSEDPAGLQEALKELGGVSKDPNSRYQQTLKRVDAMRALINGGQ